jgi:hypothetical protein
MSLDFRSRPDLVRSARHEAQHVAAVYRRDAWKVKSVRIDNPRENVHGLTLFGCPPGPGKDAKTPLQLVTDLLVIALAGYWDSPPAGKAWPPTYADARRERLEDLAGITAQLEAIGYGAEGYEAAVDEAAVLFRDTAFLDAVSLIARTLVELADVFGGVLTGSQVERLIA